MHRHFTCRLPSAFFNLRRKRSSGNDSRVNTPGRTLADPAFQAIATNRNGVLADQWLISMSSAASKID
jgi:hypothetical protein